jgi:hypothetical protein
VIQNRIEISPEAPLVRHKNPGEEIIYILEGSLEYLIDGREPWTYSVGEALLVPAETVHAVRGNGTELATYVIEKGKPFSSSSTDVWRNERGLSRSAVAATTDPSRESLTSQVVRKRVAASSPASLRVPSPHRGARARRPSPLALDNERLRPAGPGRD